MMASLAPQNQKKSVPCGKVTCPPPINYGASVHILSRHDSMRLTPEGHLTWLDSDRSVHHLKQSSEVLISAKQTCVEDFCLSFPHSNLYNESIPVFFSSVTQPWHPWHRACIHPKCRTLRAKLILQALVFPVLVAVDGKTLMDSPKTEQVPGVFFFWLVNLPPHNVPPPEIRPY